MDAERRIRVRSLHDEIKAHMFWREFDAKWLPDLAGLYRELSDNIWDSSDATNPHYVILRSVTHDFNAMLSSLEYGGKEAFPGAWGDVVTVLQTYLSDVHRMCDGIVCENAVGYTYTNSSKLTKFTALYDEGKKEWYCVNVIHEKNVPALVKMLESLSAKSRENTREWIKECMDDINRGEAVIGRSWYIVERNKK